ILIVEFCFPGSELYYEDIGYQSFACEGENSFHWGEEVMKFFKAHPKNEVKTTGSVLAGTSPGHHLYTYEGMLFDLEIPEQILDRPVGLVIDQHGYTMDAVQQNNGTDMQRLGREYGYAILQPSIPTRNVTVDWDEPIFEMVTIIMEGLNIDTDRIHVTGFSQGGRFSWRFISDHSDLLASAAPAASGISLTNAVPGCNFVEGDMPEFEIPILHIAGYRDSLYQDSLRQIAAIKDAWNLGDPYTISEDDNYKRTRYYNDNGIIVEFIEHDYSSSAPFLGGSVGGHCFPGSTVFYEDYQSQTFACEDDDIAFHWGEEAMKFFVAHPKGTVHEQPTFVGINVSQEPDKVSYEVGEALDLTGMTVTAIYSDGTYRMVSNYFTTPASGKIFDTVGTETILVAYVENGALFVTNFNVTVSLPAVLESIAISENPDKMSYYPDESLDLTGMVVTATYSDGSTKAVTDYFAYPAEGTVFDALGTVIIYIAYAEDDITKMTAFEITVVPVPVFVEGIVVSTDPDKMSYTVGETLDLTGMVVSMTYSDGSAEAIVGYGSFPQDGSVLDSIGSVPIVIMYVKNGLPYITSFTVTVSPPVVLESISVSGYQNRIYIVGDQFDMTGIVVTAKYSDGSTKPVTGYMTSPAQGTVLNNAGTQTIYVAYSEGSAMTLDFFNITVSETFLPGTAPGHYNYAYGGMIYDLEIPEEILERQVGLIIDMHGGGMTAQQQDYGSNMRALGQEYGYVILQPSAPRGMMGLEWDEPVWAMVNAVIDELNIDEKRIHAMGFSAGGAWTWRTLRDHSDVIASLAPLNSGYGTEAIRYVPSEEDPPKAEIPVFISFGLNDPIVPMDTRAWPILNPLLEVWDMDVNAGVVIAGDDTYERVRYTNANGNVVEVIFHEYVSTGTMPSSSTGMAGGHCFPGADPQYAQYTPYGCEGVSSFHLGEEVIKFFIEHPKP
ncbi:MAG: bacterial Ig-like domain-containing protein, partial [Methanomassiliicoccaceae archaeon]|nr:bacterial Ig-like domain-containing protein [Methanomassiliicoccaceae archaeon]